MNGFAPLMKKEAEMAESEIFNLLQIYMVASKIITISWDLQIMIFLDIFSEVKKKLLEAELCCFRIPQNAWNTL